MKNILNEEQIYDICLSLIALDDHYYDGPAGLFITWKICRDKNLHINEINNEELTKLINQSILEKTLEIMARKNLIEVDISGEETLYRKKKGDF